MNEGQTASMEACEAIGAPEQVEIIIKAAKSAAYKAYAFSGVPIDYQEIMGQTWENTVKGLSADRLDKANAKRAAEDKAPLTIMQAAHRAAHAAAELCRWHLNKDREALPLECWTAIDNGDMENKIINRLTIEDFIAQQDSRGQSVLELTAMGFTERQTGEAVGVSGTAVHKRLVRMRNELREAIA